MHASVPEDVRRMILAERASQAQTGPKGVLADAKMSKALDKAEREAKKQQREAVLRRMVEGHKVPAGDVTAAAAARSEELDEEDEEENDTDDDEDEDDEFMRSFREKRLGELRQQQHSAAAAPPPKEFGACVDVDAERLVDELDREDSRVLVVLHLYEPSVPTCVRLNRLLDDIAAARPRVKFLRMPGGSNGISLDRATLPILSLYRGGESTAVLAAIAHELGTDFFTREQVEELLALDE